MATRSADTDAQNERMPIAASAALRAKLKRIGLCTPSDLITHLPLRYEDETRISLLNDVVPGATAQVEVCVLSADVKFRPKRQLVVECEDETGSLILRFLNFYPNLVKTLVRGQRIRCFGELRSGFFGVEMVHPRLILVTENTALPVCLTPVYPTTAGVNQRVLRALITAALEVADVDEYLPAAAYQPLLDFPTVIRRLHAPPADASQDDLCRRTDPAWQRIKYDELLAQQLMLQRSRHRRRERGAPIIGSSGDDLTPRFLASLPFTLTGAQQRVLAEIRADLAQAFPMQRLLQGDVGSGKTVVAAYAACLAIAAGYQVALMAPTEILAQQHCDKLQSWLAPLAIEVVHLSGNLKARQKRKTLTEVMQGAPLIIGTHALIQDKVDYARLGLIIIDEQHRFGVAQRLALRKKAAGPHQLMMSATPIPRTLAMSYYADLDVSVIDELPPGRTAVRTRLVAETKRPQIVDFVRQACLQGQQVYWVCPLIEESEALQLTTALDTQQRLAAELPDFNIGLIHGRLKGDEKQQMMQAFVDGDYQILVATTVIEVGVDVPNASLMVIEHAERYGLAQLHQLRGRVGRGTRHSSCILIYGGPLSPLARARLKVIYENNDGFEIARQDLRLRGPGEFLGARQSGIPMLRYADLETDIALIERARDTAAHLLITAPEAVDKHLARWLPAQPEWLRV